MCLAYQDEDTYGAEAWAGGPEMAQTERLVLSGAGQGEEAQGHAVGSHWIDILASHWQVTLLHLQGVPKPMEDVETLKEKSVFYIQRNLVKSVHCDYFL